MPTFLASLMALVSTFAQHGKPATLPPHTQEEVSSRGEQVSEIAKSLHLEDGQNEDETSDTDEDAPEEEEQGSQSDTTKVPSENIHSGITMPALIPQVALDHSRSLAPSTGTLPTPPGQSNQGVSNDSDTSSNSTFGQGIADSQPDAARGSGRDFGQATSRSARSNSHRP